MQLMDGTMCATDPMPPEPDVKKTRTGRTWRAGKAVLTTNENQNGESPMGSEPQFQQLIGVLHRRGRLILTMAACGTILALVIGLLITPKYSAKAQIIIEPRSATLLSPEAVQQVIDTHVTMLTSANHLQHVVDSVRNNPDSRGAVSESRTKAGASAGGLDDDARSRPASSRAPVSPMTTAAGTLNLSELKRRLSVWAQALTTHKEEGTALTLDELDRRLSVMQERSSRVITIRFQWTSPEMAAAIANRIVELYIDSLTELQRAYTTREMARLEERKAAIKSDVERTSAALQKAIQVGDGARQNVGGDEHESGMGPRELERRAVTSAQLYANLLQRQKEIREQQELIQPSASILSLASPPVRPSSPNPILFMLPALLVFSISGCLLGVLLEGLDRGLRSEREVSDALGVRCIGLVPQIGRRHQSDPGKYLLAHPFSPYAEAIRSAVVVLRLAESGHAPKVVLISSSAPGEGKTTLALSMALYVASLGRRVVLLKLDRRQDSMHRDLGGKVVSEMSDRTRQRASPTVTIQRIADVDLHCLSMPRCGSDPLAMYADERVLPLLRQLREDYDIVIVDGPAVFGGSEVRLLASMADKVVFAVKWSSTRRDVARNALDLLRDSTDFDREFADTPVAIVTQVDLKKHARYRYGDISEIQKSGADVVRPAVKGGSDYAAPLPGAARAWISPANDGLMQHLQHYSRFAKVTTIVEKVLKR